MKQNRIRFIAWILLVVLMMQAAPMGVQATEIGKTALTSDELTPEYLIGTWEGTYTGSEERDIMLVIDYCNNKGVFQGCATINTDEVQYVFSGNVDFETGEISFAGTEWIYNNAGFTKLIDFSGTIDSATGMMGGCVGGNTNQTFALKKENDQYTSMRKDLSELPLDWTGWYDGKNGDNKVPRNLELHITEIDEIGNISGRAVVFPREGAAESFAANGSYYFKGTISPYTLKIDIQGYEWIDHPLGTNNETFGFVALTGMIDFAYGIISGSTGSGSWEMISMDYDCSDFSVNTGFEIGKDNQNFLHSNDDDDSTAGFKGVYWHTIPDKKYLYRLTRILPLEEIMFLSTFFQYFTPWDGDCYGLAVTMALLHEGRIGIKDLTNYDAKTYHDLRRPIEDSKFMSILKALYFSQKVGVGDYRHISESKTINIDHVEAPTDIPSDSLSVFLARLVRETLKGEVFMLQYAVGKLEVPKQDDYGGWSHTVLVTGCEFDVDKNEYVLKIYDVSSSKPSTLWDKESDETVVSGFGKFIISKDYSKFTYRKAGRNANGELVFDNEISNGQYHDYEWTELYMLTLDDIKEVTDAIFSIDSQQNSTTNLEVCSQESDEQHSILWFPIGSDTFTIENENGEYLTYDGKRFTGTMMLYDISASGSGSQSQYGIQTDYSQSFTVTNVESTIDLEVLNKNAFMALDGTNLDRATLDEVDGIEIEGDQYTFEAFLTTDEVAEGELGMVSISASVDSGKVSIASDGVQATVTSENPLEDVTTKTFIGTEVYERNLDDGMTDLVVDATDTTTVPNFTDVPEGAWYYDPVMWALEEDITSGTSDTTFSPAASCNRAQAVTFLWAAAGKPEPTITEHSFVDVPKGSFCEKAVLWAVEKGITTGTDETHFSPLTVCNRATIVTFLYKVFNSPEVNAAENPFEDVPAESWYTVPALWAKEQGITSGTDATHFSPASICNRAQIVTFLYGAYSK